MTDYPIIFSAAMVRALLDGRKVMTRRLAWRLTTHAGRYCEAPTIWQKVQPGDRLWCKETFYETDKLSRIGFLDGIPTPVVFRADIPESEWKHAKWTPSIFMSRAWSRLTLTVTAVRMERLQEISEEDAQAEGWQRQSERSDDPDVHADAARDWFSDLWESLHGKGAWASNPEVVVLSFETHMKNIDRMGEAA